MWTLQEIIVSKNPMALIGDQQIPWSFFGRVGAELSEFAIVQFHLATRASPFLNLARPLNDTGDKNADIVGPLEILRTCMAQECTDPRDRIYSLYWMLDGYEFPKPDYTRSEAQVFQDAMAAILRRGEDLNILFSIHPKRKLGGSPSWVLNFGAKVQPIPALEYRMSFDFSDGFMANCETIKKYDGAA